MLKTDFNMKII